VPASGTLSTGGDPLSLGQRWVGYRKAPCGRIAAKPLSEPFKGTGHRTATQDASPIEFNGAIDIGLGTSVGAILAGIAAAWLIMR
jgi:hypothetical protein